MNEAYDDVCLLSSVLQHDRSTKVKTSPSHDAMCCIFHFYLTQWFPTLPRGPFRNVHLSNLILFHSNIPQACEHYCLNSSSDLWIILLPPNSTDSKPFSSLTLMLMLLNWYWKSNWYWDGFSCVLTAEVKKPPQKTGCFCSWNVWM